MACGGPVHCRRQAVTRTGTRAPDTSVYKSVILEVYKSEDVTNFIH